MQTRHSVTRYELKDGRRLAFYACVFGVEAAVADRTDKGMLHYRETILPGAFAKTLRTNAEVVANIDHNNSKIFARRSDGSLLLQEDPHGLFCSTWLPETELGDEVIRRYNAGELWGCSFNALVNELPPEGGSIKRSEVELRDVCLTLSPAYEQTKGEVVIRSSQPDINIISLARIKFIKARQAVMKMKK